LNTLDFLNKTLTIENVGDLEYLNNVVSEGLRIQPPVRNSTPRHLSGEMKLGKYHILKDQALVVMMAALHRHSKQWQRPNDFLPERFDSADPLSLTPDGKKRNNFSFVPFMGGKRICFGKTFAMANLKLITTYFTQCFDFELCDERYSKDKLPISHMAATKIVPIMTRISTR